MKYFFILLLILTGFLATDISKVEAVSWQNSLTTCGASDCTTVPYYNVTVNTDKVSYDPGENISLSSFMQALYCSNSAAIYSLNAAIDGDFETLANATIVDGGQAHYSTGSLTAPTIPGVYDIELTSCHFGWGLQCSTANISITVTGTIPPTTNPPTNPPVSPAAIISGNTCKISSAASTCIGTLSWLISNATNPNVYNNNGTTYSTNVEGNNQPVVFDYGLNTIYARNGVTSLFSINIVTACDDGLVWSGGSCGVLSSSGPTFPPPMLEVTFDNNLIRSGETAETYTKVTAPYKARCTLFGVSSAPIVFIHDGQINATHTYTHTTRPLNSSQLVTVTCEPDPAIPGVVSATVDNRIDVVPTVQEI
jgi:hypothetical protein